MQRCWSYAAALALSVASFGATAADLVVIESSAAGVKVGSMVAAGAILSVPDKAKVVLASESGQIVTVSGPFQGPPPVKEGASGGGRIAAALSSLVRENQKDSSSVGAVRAAGVDWRTETAATAADALAIDVVEGGEACVYNAEGVELIRNPSSPAAAVTILSLESGESVSLDWPKGALRQPWPKKLPVADGGTYVIEEGGQSGAVMTTVHLLPASGASSEIERVAQLAESGCSNQAKALLTVMTKGAK